MPCYMALQIVSFSDCSLCRTLLRGWSLTGLRERSTSTSRLADPEVSALVTNSATGDLQAGNSGAQMR